MADDELASEFDAIVLGTGLTESIVAAALARIGQKVLHLDRNQYYGSQWATFSFQELLDWIESYQEDRTEDVASPAACEGYDLIPVPSYDRSISNIVVKSIIRDDNMPTKVDTDRDNQFLKSADAAKNVEDLDGAPGGNGGISEVTADFHVKHEDRQSTNEGDESISGEDIHQNGDDKTTIKVTPMDIGDVNQASSEIFQATSDYVCPQISNEIPQKMSHESCQQTSDHISQKVSDETTIQVSQMAQHMPCSEDSNDEKTSENALSDQAVENPVLQGHLAVGFQEPQLATLRLTAQSKISSHASDISLADFKCLSRKFNLDIAPKLLFSRGLLIELLVNANISHYSEFRTAERILTFKENEIMQVPCCRADVFGSDTVNVMEKRVLMKFLSFCANYQESPHEYEAFADKPFTEFLTHRKLSKNLQHYVVHAIAMVKEDADTLMGLHEAQKFIASLGRYSNSPFVWTNYGVAELPQAFCRVSAVFGGTYCLHRSATAFKISKEDSLFNAIVCTKNQEISAKYIIMERSYLPHLYSYTPRYNISRAILITDRSLKISTSDHVTLLTIPPGNGIKSNVRIIEIGPSSMGCPVGLYVVHMTMTGDETAEKNLQPVIDLLFDEENVEDSPKPRLFWCVFFNQHGRDYERSAKLPKNMFVTRLPGESLGFEESVEEARQIFDDICPNAEFLPAVPNPEDIIWDDANKQLKPAGGFVEDGDAASCEKNDGDGDIQGDPHQGGNEVVEENGKEVQYDVDCVSGTDDICGIAQDGDNKVASENGETCDTDGKSACLREDEMVAEMKTDDL